MDLYVIPFLHFSIDSSIPDLINLHLLDGDESKTETEGAMGDASPDKLNCELRFCD